MHISWLSGAEEEMASPSPPLGAERVGVRWGILGRRPPTSPSHACGVGPFLSPLKGGEGFPTDPARYVHALALSRGQRWERRGPCPYYGPALPQYHQADDLVVLGSRVWCGA